MPVDPPTAGEQVALRLLLRPGDGPIAGELESAGERVEFSGWIELAALIESRRPVSRSRSPGRPAAARGS